MKRFITAIALGTATLAAPAFADTALNGTVISTMGDRSVVSLTPRERAIGNGGLVEATTGDAVQLSAERVLLEREEPIANGEYITGYRFPSNGSAVTPYGAR